MRCTVLKNSYSVGNTLINAGNVDVFETYKRRQVVGVVVVVVAAVAVAVAAVVAAAAVGRQAPRLHPQ